MRFAWRVVILLVFSAMGQGVGAAQADVPLEASFPGSLVDSDAGRGSDSIPALDCLLTPSLDTQVASPVPGVVARIAVRRGDKVKKGGLLVRLRSEAELAALRLKKAQAEYGLRTIERNTELYREKLISEQDKDDIIIKNRVYSLEMEQARVALSQKTIVSPVTGIVVDALVEPGEYVGSDPVVHIVKLDPLYVDVTVPALYYGKIKVGEEVPVTLEQPLNSEHMAKVFIVDSVIDAASSTFRVRLKLANPGNRLPSGLRCRVRFAN